MVQKNTLKITMPGPPKSFEIASDNVWKDGFSVCIYAHIKEDKFTWRIGQVILEIRNDRSALIYDLWVFSPFRNQGVSWFLIQESERIAKSKIVEKIKLYTEHEYLKNSWCKKGYVFIEQLTEDVEVSINSDAKAQNDENEKQVIARAGSYYLSKEFS